MHLIQIFSYNFANISFSTGLQSPAMFHVTCYHEFAQEIVCICFLFPPCNISCLWLRDPRHPNFGMILPIRIKDRTNICTTFLWIILTNRTHFKYYSVFGFFLSSDIHLNTMFHKWIYFSPLVRGWETPTLLSPLETPNLNHWNACIQTRQV
jgi:hypothetical protein